MGERSTDDGQASGSQASSPAVTRRRLLGGATGLAVAGVAGGVGLSRLSGSAAAAASSFSISGASLSNDDGDITQVGVAATHRVEWDGFDDSVDAAAYRDVIQKLDGNGDVVASAVLYDNRSSPVLLSNWSSEGSGGDGWGGPGEWTSGPGTEGFVRANIDWTVLAEDPSSAAKSVENPGDIDNFDMDNPTDDSTKNVTLRYVKQVTLYSEDSGGSYTSADGSTTLRKMGGDDGTVGTVEATDAFAVKITNEGATTSSSGSGSASAS